MEIPFESVSLQHRFPPGAREGKTHPRAIISTILLAPKASPRRFAIGYRVADPTFGNGEGSG
jgi:hypothetical protein